MACGTPVIALRRGSAPELIAQGKTGFVVDTVDEMVEAIPAVRSIKRDACRAYVQRNFSPGIMAEAYLRVYQEVLNSGGRSPVIREGIVPAGPGGQAVTAA